MKNLIKSYKPRKNAKVKPIESYKPRERYQAYIVLFLTMSEIDLNKSLQYGSFHKIYGQFH